MAMQIKTEGRIVEIKATGTLAKSDYERCALQAEPLIERYGKVRMLVELQDFQGWSAGGLWGDLKFDIKHFSDVERLAIIGESKWHEATTRFFKPFTRAEVRYFTHEQADEARRWIEEGLGAEENAGRGVPA